MLETPLSLVGYFSNLQKQLVFVTNERICKKIGGDRPFRLNFTFEHSVGQGNSTSRLTKEDVLFLKANTRYNEETIQVIFIQY